MNRTRNSFAPAHPGPAPKVRKVRLTYPPTRPDAISGVVSFFNATVAHYHSAGAVRLPPLDGLIDDLPRGCIRSARVIDLAGGPAVSFGLSYGDHTGEGTPRYLPPLGFLLFRALTLFQAETFEGADYQNVSCLGSDIALTRIMANAGPGEVVHLPLRLGDLRPGSLLIAPGRPRAHGSREDAIAAALQSHRTNAGPWGVSALMIREDYEGLIRDCFRLFDHEYGYHFVRPVKLGRP